MPPIIARWTKLAATPQLQRSSHSVSAIGSSLYIFGGELKPREPRDNDVHKIDITGTNNTAAAVVECITAPAVAPQPRVGTAMTRIGGTMYVFSGRGGPEMAPVEERGRVWALDTGAQWWRQIEPAAGDFPAARSYHCMATDGKDTIYVHAGCPEKGRVGDLWAFGVAGREWRRLAAAPDPPRGGTSIAFAEGKLYRMNGFDGEREQGGQLDVFDPASNSWSSVAYRADGKDGPGARSVAALLPVRLPGGTALVTLFGESDPSSLGHQGAGKMLGDIWAYSLAEGRWSQVTAQAEASSLPDARGWFDADVVALDGKDSIAVAGGLGETNERLGDVWLLSF